MSDSARRLFWWITALLVVVLLLSAEAAISIHQIDGPKMLLSYLGYLSAASVCIGFIVWAMDRWCPAIFIPALSLGFAFLVFSLRLNFLSVALDLSFGRYLISFVCLWSVIWLALRVGVAENRVPKPEFIAAVVAVLAIPTVFSIGAFVAEATRRASLDDKANAQMSRALPAGWEKLRFVERPNIYLLSFDSLIPADVAAAYLKIDRPDYYRLATGLLRELPNSLVFKVPSVNSLNALMRLDQKQSASAGQNLFTGNGFSPLGEVARLNGYGLVTGWPGYVPKWRRGGGVDRVIYPLSSGHAEESFLCEGEMGSGRRIKIRGLFFCPMVMSIGGFMPDRRVELQPFRDTVLEAAMDVARAAQPTIFFAYTYDPIGHTSQDFDYRSRNQLIAYRDQFRAKSILATEIIQRNVISIRSVDPTAIIMIFGDHGAYLSRGLDPSDDPKFFHSDRHRVFLAVASGGHSCGSPEQVYSGGIYNTPSRVLLDVMICLSGGVAGFPVAFDEDPQLVGQVFR
jgi:hypothetical protein